jgi:hypothetical protein
MSVFFGVIVILVLTAVAVVLFGIWAGPFSLILGGLFIAYVMAARKDDGRPAVSLERGRRTEPTGMPRHSSGSAQTANERVGQ